MTADYEKKLTVVKTQLQREIKNKQKILSLRTDDVPAKSDLKYVFIDCIEQVRREIFKRKSYRNIYYDKQPNNELYFKVFSILVHLDKLLSLLYC